MTLRLTTTSVSEAAQKVGGQEGIGHAEGHHGAAEAARSSSGIEEQAQGNFQVGVDQVEACREKSTRGKAKRSTAVSKSDLLVTRNYTKKPVEKDDGRYTLDSEIDYSETEGWNPRPGSTPDVIQRLLKRFRGNRNKVS